LLIFCRFRASHSTGGQALRCLRLQAYMIYGWLDRNSIKKNVGQLTGIVQQINSLHTLT